MTLENYKHYLQEYLILQRRSFKKDIVKIEKYQKLLDCIESTISLEWYMEHFKDLKNLKTTPEELCIFLNKKLIFTYCKNGIIGEDPYEVIDILPFTKTDESFLKELSADVKKIEKVKKTMQNDKERLELLVKYNKNKKESVKNLKETLEK